MIIMENETMDYEKLYKEAIERAKSWAKGEHPECFSEAQKAVDFIFPELKESEDEMIRKEIIKCVKYYGPETANPTLFKDMLAWLEKQGEQKPVVIPKFRVGDKVKDNYLTYTVEDIDEDSYKLQAYSKDGHKGSTVFLTIGHEDDYELVEQNPVDKHEHKFKVGDWIINNDKRIAVPIQILKIEKYGYVVSDGYTSFDKVKTDYHLWTIQDANDGDVLVASDNSIFLFKGLIDCACEHYVALTTDGDIEFNVGLKHFWETSSAVHPATKEQRDLLFAKMKEVGYEWDAEKKELIKIENVSAWSEEDESMFDSIIEDVMPCGECPDYPTDEEREYFYEGYRKVRWLKLLKERFKNV